MPRIMKFKIPGIYHETDVYLVSRKYLTEKYKKLEGKKALTADELLHGFYSHTNNIIYIAKELAPDWRFHTFMHELVHMMEDETEHLDLENKADIVGKYIGELFRNEEFRGHIKTIIENGRLK